MAKAPPSLFTLCGQAAEGKRLGSRLGFPTANLAYDAAAHSWPADGVYIATARIGEESREYTAILNQGKHPTAPEGAPTVEAHLLGYLGGALYGKALTLTYQVFLRPEKRFASLDALKEQLQKDLLTAADWERKNASFNEKSKDDNMPNTAETPMEMLGVSYQYEEEGAPAVQQVTLSVQKGSFVAVLGHNGSGKSTLAKMMNGLYLPTEGQVWVCGMNTADEEHVWDVRKNAGMVFQNPDNQIVATVVREDVAFGLENIGVPPEEMILRIDEALAAVRMTGFTDSAPHMLSGGQKQRVAIAGVLAMAPNVMILDEVTAMLDPSGRKEVLKTVRKLNRERGITVVWITHFMEEASLADRVVVLHKGAIALDGPPAEVFCKVEKIRELGLDVPPMAELAQSLRNAGLPLPQGILTVTDMVKELKETLCPSKSNT